jgi:peptidoglycan/xylan/chitin deacetylase (PgdA/CDA1 family)
MILLMKKNILDWFAVVGMSILLLSVALMLFFNVVQNYVDINSVFGAVGKKNIYILESSNTKKRLKAIGIDSENYSNNIDKIKAILQKKDFDVIVIDEMGLNTLTNKDILLIIDSISISNFAQQQIISFVKNGGSLLFNFNSGFIDEKGNFTETKMIEEITSLKKEGYVKRDKSNTFFLVSKLLSPISIPNGKRLDIVLYDQIPIFSGKEPYLEFVNWSMSEPIKNGETSLPNGALWSGNYGKGGWVYFSFPFYAMDSTEKDSKYYHMIFENMVDYLYKGVKAVAYPYIRYDKMVFVSEDTEFKFENLKQFVELVKKYELNATAFCVGNLAEKNVSLMKMAGNVKNVEIASHSYSHSELLNQDRKKLTIELELNKKLLEQLSNKKVLGFRPPREEIDARIFEILKENKYQYVMEKNLGQIDIRLKDGLVTIPRIGTDDYGYLIQLDWNKNKIISKIKEEAKFITNLNAIYTLSTHTHLMTYRSNISMLEEVFKFFKQEKYPVLKGKDIAFLSKQRRNIEIKVVQTELNFILKIKNKNYEDVKNLKVRLYLNKALNVTGIISEFSGLKSKLIKYENMNYVDIEIENLRRNTNFDLFLSYK